MGLSFWRSGIIAAETADGAVSLVGSERPPMECCSGRAPRPEIGAILECDFVLIAIPISMARR
jgi:hypothetical protein